LTRISRGQHTHQTVIANDPSKDISANQWNDIAGPVYAHVETGMLGIPASVTSIVLSSGAALVVDTHSVIQASVSPGSDTLKNITNTNTNAKDIIALIAKSGDTITVSHNDSGTGDIFLLGAVNKTLSETVPMLLFRVGNNWYEFNNSTLLTNAQIAAAAGIAYSKLTLTGAVVNADISSSAAIAASKINGTAAVLNVNNVFTAGLTMSGADITLAGNKIKTTSYNFYESSILSGNEMYLTTSTTNGNTFLALSPNGTSRTGGLQLFRTSDITTNYEVLQFRTDYNVSGEFATEIEKAGSGTLRPWNIYMNGTKLLSFDTANTITSYVATTISASGSNMFNVNSTSGDAQVNFSSPSGSNDVDFRLITTGTDTWQFLASRANRELSLGVFGTLAGRLDINGNVIIGVSGANATNATNGFLYIPTCAGTPTGVPTSKTGKVPIIYDTTNNIIYIYNGAWKKTSALT